MNPKTAPPSLHSNFFSSLKQVEKRLKLENRRASTALEINFTESLSTPIYLLQTEQEPIFINNNSLTSLSEESSEPPLAFLSPSFHSSPAQQKQPPKISQYDPETDAIDDIQRLIQLLGISDCRERNPEQEQEIEKICVDGGGGECCGCEGLFFEKIVGVKGPKCEREVERLEGWIRYFSGGGGGDRTEPLRLAFLLLGKAASEFEVGNSGNLEFPSTIEEFLKLDPPRH